MGANALAIFTKNGKRGSVLITAGNTSSEGGGTVGVDIFLCFTAGAEGAFVEYVRFIATGTTPTLTTATVGRVFRSSIAAGATTPADTFLVDEVTLPAVNADNATTAVNKFDVPINCALAPNETLLVTCHVATAWRAVAMGAGDY